MYAFLLTVHSLVRWLVLISLTLSTIKAFRGWIGGGVFSGTDKKLLRATVSITHLQFVIGLGLYFFSPTVRYFLGNFSAAVHERDPRFFGVEHITMMAIAIVLITVGSSKTKRRATDQGKFKTMAIWLGVGLLIIFLSIPWSFSPFTSRPYFRFF